MTDVNFCALPVELLYDIFMRCSPCDLLVLRSTCNRLREVISAKLIARQILNFENIYRSTFKNTVRQCIMTQERYIRAINEVMLVDRETNGTSNWNMNIFVDINGSRTYIEFDQKALENIEIAKSRLINTVIDMQFEPYFNRRDRFFELRLTTFVFDTVNIMRSTLSRDTFIQLENCRLRSHEYEIVRNIAHNDDDNLSPATAEKNINYVIAFCAKMRQP